ncbi:MAG: class I SAM-dependent methyltransferase [Clostridiales Family XIII bacterium]|jgi:SAM-dependent methyltransferase|nr:class I SAM-dependent methyltransferase [Clostridiales Family XIII bacterium]
MRFEWTDETIVFFERASRYTGFHEKLAALIRPYVKKGEELIDVGCGLGRIDFEIADDVKSITAIDKDPAVIEYMNERVRVLGVTNIVPTVADACTVADGAYDILLLSFFGASAGDLKALIAKARRRVILITHGADTDPRHSLIQRKPKRIFAREAETFFKTEGYVYRAYTANLDFSQPFKSKEEALRFFEYYASERDSETQEARADLFMSRLAETGDAVYPYLLPKPKDVGIFIIESRGAL